MGGGQDNISNYLGELFRELSNLDIPDRFGEVRKYLRI